MFLKNEKVFNSSRCLITNNTNKPNHASSHLPESPIRNRIEVYEQYNLAFTRLDFEKVNYYYYSIFI